MKKPAVTIASKPRRPYHKHGLSKLPQYFAWMVMHQRCYNPKVKSYRNYGARGVTICERWHDFDAFFADMGPRPPGATIDRINNDGNYEPSNCRWASYAEQARNRRGIRMATFNGKTQIIKDWAVEFGLNLFTVYARIRRGATIEQALAPLSRKTASPKSSSPA